jgi:hypothetical protein
MSREIAKIITPEEMTKKQLINELLDTVKEDVMTNELTALTHLFEVLLGFEINRQILEEYLS